MTGFFAVLPATLRRDTSIPPNAILLYCEIVATTNEYGYSRATNKQLGEMRKVTDGTVSAHITALCKAGHIQRHIIRNADNTVEERRLYPVAISPDLLHQVHNPSQYLAPQDNRSYEACLALLNEASRGQKDNWTLKANQKNLDLEEEKRKYINHKLKDVSFNPNRANICYGFDSWMMNAFPKKQQHNGKGTGKKSDREKLGNWANKFAGQTPY